MVETTVERWAEAEILGYGDTLAVHARPCRSGGQLSPRAVAQRQSAKFWELRAALDLARLWRDQGKRSEARDLLAPVYGWFTEGFDTPVLRDAQVLLDQLG